jgi:hypothetical protein
MNISDKNNDILYISVILVISLIAILIIVIRPILSP